MKKDNASTALSLQDQHKKAVAMAALNDIPAGAIVGVGTGSTVNFLIEGLATIRERITAAVASSEASAARLKAHGIPLLDLNEVDNLPVYIDGADEINPQLMMIKGGGGALTREKIVAAEAEKFICICDQSKYVSQLGKFPLPVEVIPMAQCHVAKKLQALGGHPVVREGVMTDNGNVILDVHQLIIDDPRQMENAINQITGVVTNGLFAERKADLLLLSDHNGVQRLTVSG